MTTSFTRRRDFYDAMTVTVPEGESGNVAIKRFEVTEDDLRFSQLRAIVNGGRGMTPAGTYTKLTRNGSLWMSGTQDEKRDHFAPLWKAQDAAPGSRALVTGLGIGMVVRALILASPIDHIDVVEIDEDVIKLVGPHYEELASEHGKTIAIHHGDAHDRAALFNKDDRWVLAWHDIWQDICADNWDSMKSLGRRYGRYTDWQGCWSKDETQYAVERERKENARWEMWRR